MQFSTSTFLTALFASLVTANTVTFTSLDQTERTVYFTPNAGLKTIDPVTVPAGKNITVDIPNEWIGNFYSVSAGKPNVPGMLGEVNFNSWMGLTYFDVSAIVDPTDHDGVQLLYPKNDKKPASGCAGKWPCNNAYYLPDDIQTKATNEVDLVCELGVGTGGLAVRDIEEEDAPVFVRNFVVRKW